MLWVPHLCGMELVACMIMLLHVTQVVGSKHFISVCLEIIYSENLCNQHFSKEQQSFSCNEDKQVLMLFKKDENVSKDRC